MSACDLDSTSNTAPSIDTFTPAEGAIVSGPVVAISIDASDNEDPVGSLNVEWQIDGGAWIAATYNSTTGRYESSWNTSALLDDAHTLTVRATDSAPATTTDSHSVTSNNGNTAGTSHIELLTGITSTGRGGKWNAEVMITVYDSTEKPVKDATVSGSWSAGASGSSSCVTDTNGTCSVTKNNIRRKTPAVTFSVDLISHALLSYKAADNNFSIITLDKPN